MQIEIVPIEKVSGISPDARCESIGCGRVASKDVIVSFQGEPEYGYTSCDEHVASFEARLQEENSNA